MIKASVFLVIFLISNSIVQNYAVSDASAIANTNKRLHNDFDWKLTEVVNGKEKGNFVVSPLSVKLALAMVYPGIQGIAAKQIEDALNINSTQKETVGEKFSSLMKSIKTNEKTGELNIGTTVFVDNSFQINRHYAQQLQHDYNSTVQVVDFAEKKNTKTKMNDWCNEVTNGKLQEMFTGDEFSSDTGMILLNAIFFRGDWQFSFNKTDTKSEKFFISQNGTSLVEMMSLRDVSLYYNRMDEIKAEFIKLPYMDGKFAMYILYPFKVDGVEELANGMNLKILSKMVENSYPMKMNLKLPKFKFDSSTELIEVLKMMNITEIFGKNADLNLIGHSPKGPLEISNFLQKSGIDVNEKGSTAYAATSLGIDTKMEPSDISITHPFMFLIVDETQKNIIFIGKVIEPVWSSTTHQKAKGKFLNSFFNSTKNTFKKIGSYVKEKVISTFS